MTIHLRHGDQSILVRERLLFLSNRISLLHQLSDRLSLPSQTDLPSPAASRAIVPRVIVKETALAV